MDLMYETRSDSCQSLTKNERMNFEAHHLKKFINICVTINDLDRNDFAQHDVQICSHLHILY